MNRRSAIRAAIGGMVAAVWPWKAKATALPIAFPVSRMFETTISNVTMSSMRRITDEEVRRWYSVTQRDIDDMRREIQECEKS